MFQAMEHEPLECPVRARLGAAAAILVVGTVAAFAGPYQQDVKGPRPVVVELYTSQGCASCPPADQVLAELADRKDVLTLTFPVDYWDYLGWSDTLARPPNAQRQVAYARRTQAGRVFTPQIVIDGVYSAVGSKRADVLNRIAARQAQILARQAALHARASAQHARAVADFGLRIAIEGEEVKVSLPADEARIAQARPKAAVWLFPFGKTDMVHITAGENRGRSVRYTHVVRNVVMLGEWNGKAATFEHTLTDHDRGQYGYAVIVQEDGVGPVVAASWAGDQDRMGRSVPRPEPRIVADPLLVNIQL
jgi:hypothetical protein